MTARLPTRGTIYFCFVNPTGFSGQKAATELAIRGLEERGWNCRRLSHPVFDHYRGKRGALLRYGLGLLAAWLRTLRLLFSPRAWLCVNLCQTRAGFVRDLLPLLLGSVSLGRKRIVISLHGSLFMQWMPSSLDGRVFRFLLRRAGTVTVLGERQRARLIEHGISAERVVVLVNSCDLEIISIEATSAKHPLQTEADRPVRCLFLSSLIDTKGFPEYLEALQQLAMRNGPSIDAVMCGRLVASEFSGRFRNLAESERWIEQQLTAINLSARVRVRWIKGAVGADKAALFRDAAIFVLPTRYAVEAQPLVLLEAMASGCAIITTRAGEIPTILDEQGAVLLAEPSAESVADAMRTLVLDAKVRRRYALTAQARFVDRYQVHRHIDAWEALLARGMTDRSPRAPQYLPVPHAD